MGSELQRSCFILFISKVCCGKRVCNSLGDLCIENVQEHHSSAQGLREKKKIKEKGEFILIFWLCFKIPDSSEVSVHRILIIPCQS